ncbi:MAG TPA: PhzF family phenazine biosynthesis protein [Jatrophihabitans sp.]|nr:PhzF family phenazine biosynthesis protein [Jatrophihabitans sp.]
MTATADGLPVTLVDAFARRPGEGNRAAVVRLPDERPTDWLADLARSLDQPVTVYVWQQSPDRAQLRWFAPSGELFSCGHGTLAAAHLLLPDAPDGELELATPLGRLRADRPDGDVRISMPLVPTEPWPIEAELSEWLGVPVVEVRRSDRHGVARLAIAADVRSVRPDLDTLATRLPTVGLAVTAPGIPPYDIVSRWFVPRHGLEDQATGTAHCLLAGLWAERLGRTRLRAWQASANGAEFDLTVHGRELLLAGGAITVGRQFAVEQVGR